MRLTVTDGDGRDLWPYIEMLEEVGDDELARIDREQACPRIGEGEVGDLFTFAELSRPEQAQLLHVLDSMGRTKRPNPMTPTSYGLKHVIEKAVGIYTTSLHVKSAARVLGLVPDRGPYCRDANLKYNLSARGLRAVEQAARGRSYRGRDGSGVPVTVAVVVGSDPIPIAEFAAWWTSTSPRGEI